MGNSTSSFWGKSAATPVNQIQLMKHIFVSLRTFCICFVSAMASGCSSAADHKPGPLLSSNAQRESEFVLAVSLSSQYSSNSRSFLYAAFSILKYETAP
uniref:Uncharacterized protein n=1 Tax=Mus spicilegus TaxID=10103 RepID=A0A8C6GL39_MUSSI